MSAARINHHSRHDLLDRVAEIGMALSMTVGRGAAARAAAELAHVGPGDRLVDLGCGPGTAVRHAAALGATATGVDPSDEALRLAKWITSLRRTEGASFVKGSAESIPLSSGQATVVWSLSSVHHWGDRRQGLAEARRLLAAGGRLLLAERLVASGARGHAAHGLTSEQSEELLEEAKASGFADVRRQVVKAGRRTLVVVLASAPEP